MTAAPSPRTIAFSPAERTFIRQELAAAFGVFPSLAAGIRLTIWTSGSRRGQPKVSPVLAGLIERGLMDMPSEDLGRRAYFTQTGLLALRTCMRMAATSIRTAMAISARSLAFHRRARGGRAGHDPVIFGFARTRHAVLSAAPLHGCYSRGCLAPPRSRPHVLVTLGRGHSSSLGRAAQHKAILPNRGVPKSDARRGMGKGRPPKIKCLRIAAADFLAGRD